MSADLAVSEAAHRRERTDAEVVQSSVALQTLAAALVDQVVVLRKLTGANERIVRDEIGKRGRLHQPLLIASNPARDDTPEVQRTLQLDERRLKRRVVRVDEAEVDLAFVPKAGPVQCDRILLDQCHSDPASRQLERNPCTLEAGAENDDAAVGSAHLRPCQSPSPESRDFADFTIPHLHANDSGDPQPPRRLGSPSPRVSHPHALSSRVLWPFFQSLLGRAYVTELRGRSCGGLIHPTWPSPTRD